MLHVDEREAMEASAALWLSAGFLCPLEIRGGPVCGGGGGAGAPEATLEGGETAVPPGCTKESRSGSPGRPLRPEATLRWGRGTRPGVPALRGSGARWLLRDARVGPPACAWPRRVRQEAVGDPASASAELAKNKADERAAVGMAVKDLK